MFSIGNSLNNPCETFKIRDEVLRYVVFYKNAFSLDAYVIVFSKYEKKESIITRSAVYEKKLVIIEASSKD